jgi:selenocysteine lyase/cysteine desulfurase
MLPSQRHLFDVPPGVAYFNNGSFTPLPRPVRDAGDAGVAAKSTPWLIDPDATRQTAEATRAAAAGFIGATADDIAIVHSAAYGIATAAANLPIPAGTRILLIEGEFPSQSLEWARRAELTGAALDMVRRPADGDWTGALLRHIQSDDTSPISVAALTPLLWTDGTLIDLERLVPELHRRGAAVVIDATQAAGILPIDVGLLRPDYLVFPTYKWLLGPYTLAFLYVAPHRQDGTPLEQHGNNRMGGTEPFAGTLGPPIPTARRFDMGQRYNPVSLPMALAGMQLLHGWGREPIAARLRGLTDQLAERAEACGLTVVPRAQRPPHILGVKPPAGHDAGAMVTALERHSVYVAERGGTLRVAPHVYNDEADVMQFGAALERILGSNGGPA